MEVCNVAVDTFDVVGGMVGRSCDVVIGDVGCCVGVSGEGSVLTRGLVVSCFSKGEMCFLRGGYVWGGEEGLGGGGRLEIIRMSQVFGSYSQFSLRRRLNLTRGFLGDVEKGAKNREASDFGSYLRDGLRAISSRLLAIPNSMSRSSSVLYLWS